MFIPKSQLNCSIVCILSLGIATSLNHIFRSDLSFLTNSDSASVLELAQFDSFSEAEIGDRIREAECNEVLIEFADELTQFQNRKFEYFTAYQRWLRQHVRPDSIETFRMFQIEAGQPPEFDRTKWLPLIEATYQEFEDKEIAPRLKRSLFLVRKLLAEAPENL